MGVKPSYRTINYALRPHKSVERKMLVEAFRMLYPFVSLPNYRYVGFGSTTFVDFTMMHKQLGISDLISIEHASDPSRFEFNAPFGCVNLELDMSSRVLPKLDWEKPTIVWLDYDYGLDGSVLFDIRTVIERAVPGTLLLVSLNAEPRAVGTGAQNSEVDTLKDAIGANLVPTGLIPRDFIKWGKANIYRNILNDQVASNLIQGKASGNIADATKACDQVFDFHYSDGARMLTVGWLIHQSDDAAARTLEGLNSLSFTRQQGTNAFLIDLPVLTMREVMHMEKQLPNAAANVTSPGLPPGDIENFWRIYKYYPMFIETELR